MTFARHILFPALRLLVWAVIAVALVRLAFGGGAAPGADAEPPVEATADFTDPVVPVSTGDVANTVTVDAVVVADAPVEAKAGLAGTVGYLAVADGTHVEAGAPLLEIRQEEPVPPREVVGEDGTVTMVEQAPKVRRSTVQAPSAGTFALKVMLDQEVAVGDVVATVTPGTHSVTGDLSAEQQYRLLDAPSEAEVAVVGGPAPFTCTDLSIGTEVTTAPGEAGQPGPAVDPMGEPADPTTSATVEVRCAVPAGVTVFPGLGGTMTITAGQATGVLTVPVTAVQGLFSTGNVWVVGEDGGEPVETPVKLGLTDGTVVQVVEGLAEGDTILEFVPVGDVSPLDEPTDEPAVF
ncbi:secretion protein HlyD [Georgenia sp. TF02-10]|uniref:secretion protein HlyD n=1 Tax=Georgenia sp. TF02-10 TaxID=2917725 RepID=UPI001FA7D5D6|nr:secretion protein HlyD [Georgenia sp. TF02-10]UNX54208.1 secretion protein HlyD [Georgenia sp. TF02-10]